MVETCPVDLLPAYARLSTAFDEPDWRDGAVRSNAEPIPRALSLRIVISGGFERLLREIELIAPHFDRDRDVVALQVDANVELNAASLGALVDSLGRHFHFAPVQRHARAIAVNAPLLRDGDIATLAKLGFGRIDLAAGVDDLAGALRALDAARQQGMRVATIETTLPAMTAADGTSPCLQRLIAARPDQLTLCLPEEPEDEARIGALAAIAGAMDAGGYRDIGLDARPLAWLAADGARIAGVADAHGAGAQPRPGDDVDLIGLGAGARSHIGDAVSENFPDPDAWRAAIDEGRLPIWRGLTLDADARLRADVLGQWLRSGEIRFDGVERRHGIAFTDYFADALERLGLYAQQGLANCAPGYVRATSQGRLMLRIMARCFDPTARYR